MSSVDPPPPVSLIRKARARRSRARQRFAEKIAILEQIRDDASKIARNRHKGQSSDFMPSRFMRARHPHLFSDSKKKNQTAVTREVLSYHLDTLTSQKNEIAFENFARRMVERFIAPNIRPQTGPTGGGDGKTDAETYPVASEIALRWYTPYAPKPGERFAFAFSAQKTWRAKLKADVKGIAETARSYDRVYFITNQFAPARESAALQDDLVSKFRIPVTILDRTWILDRVLQHNALDIAVEELGVGFDTEVTNIGPKDLERRSSLDALEKDLQDGSKYQDNALALADDALRAAILARGLEGPRFEVDGRFDRAVRIARDRGLHKHELAAAYDWAWTSLFWYDDHAKTNAIYNDVERLALESDEADELERLVNLLAVLRVSVRTGNLSSGEASLETRTRRLTESLERVRHMAGRPSNALHAYALLLMSKVSERTNKDRNDPLIDIWKEFIGVVHQASGLGTFPFRSIADILSEVGDHIPESVEFDQLFELVTDAVATRSSEGEAGSRNVSRAFQKLEKKLPYDAIRWFGRGTHLLVKEEYEDELVHALFGSSLAYEAVGLNWAARNYALAALSQQLSAFRKTSSVDTINPSLLRRYFWMELRHGRVPQILSAYELDIIVQTARARSRSDFQRLADRQHDHGSMVGALILQTPFDELSALSNLPDAFSRISMPHARGALLYLLGYEDILRTEGQISEDLGPDQLTQLMSNWRDYASELGLPSQPDFGLEDAVLLRSRVLGCDITLACDNNMSSITLAEAILGALEALLATSLTHRMLPRRDRLLVLVGPNSEEQTEPTLSFSDEGGEMVGVITHPKRFRLETRDDALRLPNWLKNAVIELFTKFAAPLHFENWARTLFEEENAFDRALTFSNVPLMMSNIVGDKESVTVADWIEPSDRIYELNRDKPALPPRTNERSKIGATSPRPDNGPPPTFDYEQVKHDDFRVISPIDVEKWDAAKWDATLFMFAPDADDIPPVLGLGYKNREPARSIFEGLRRRFGDDDKSDSLRIVVVRGISQQNPLAYAVIVGPNIEQAQLSPDGYVMIASRINRMYPSSSRNLDGFLAEFAKHQRFLLVPAHFPDRSAQPEPMIELAIGKHHLTVREAWQIGDNDLDASALDLDDPPIIPIDQPNAPVLRALERLRTLRDRAGP